MQKADTLCVNAFRLKKSLGELDWNIHIFKVENLSATGKKRFRELSSIANQVATILKARTTFYAPSEEENYIVVINPSNDIKESILIRNYVLKLVRRNVPPQEVREPIRRILYKITSEELLKHRMWQASRHCFYRFLFNKHEDLGKYRIYQGVFFRYEILEDGTILLILDSLVKITTDDTLKEIISQIGLEKAKKELKGRYVLVETLRQTKKGLDLNLMLTRFGVLHTDKFAGKTSVVPDGEELVTIKDYYRRRGAEFFIKNVEDDELLFQAEGTPYHYATSKARLVVHFDELTRDERKKLSNVIYPSADQRASLIREFLMLVNNIDDPILGKIEFEEEFYLSDHCIVLDPPRLRFNESTLIERPDLKDSGTYRKFFKTKLKAGLAKSVSIPLNYRIAIVYPNDLRETHVLKFYKELRRVCSKVFGVNLPEEIYAWQYQDRGDLNNIRKNFESYKGNIVGVLVILRDEDDELYVEFKKIFKDVPNQMLTLKLMWMPVMRPDRKGIYHNALQNLILGLLCKIGFRPWLLADKLMADLYIGIDTAPSKAMICTTMDSYGDYISESRRIIRGQVLPSDEMSRLITQVVSEAVRRHPSIQQNNLFVVVHKDGRLLPDELDGILESKDKLKEAGINVGYAIVSIRKNVPYRILKTTKDGFEACKVGSYVRLDSRRALLASSGAPLLSQGLARPLLLEIHYTDEEAYTIDVAAKEIYDLSYMHWATLTQKIKLPATVKFADDFAYLVKEGIEEEIIGPPL